MSPTIGFDADDTLWQNEHLYTLARERFRAILLASGALPDPTRLDTLDAAVHEVEVANLPRYGYGITSFIMSLIETAIVVTDGRISGRAIAEVQAIGPQMLAAEVTLLDDVEETLEELAADYPLVLITKGDLLHQQEKVARSGIDHYFRHVEVVSDKTPAVYAGVLRRLGIGPGAFVMVGNSMRSDILPVVALGGRGVYVPNDHTWHYENATLPEEARQSVVEAASMKDVAGLVRGLFPPE